MQRFLIIDGNAIVHRAFHALPPLTKNDQQINAVYGFFSMLLKVIEDVRPSYIAVCFDRPAPTFRKALYAGYQAHRPEMADDLSPQFAILYDALEKSHVTMFGIDGYEADDLIGTLATQAVKKNKEIQVVIVTGDRDLLQLVNDRVKILMPVLGITKMIEYNSEKVEEKFGIIPSQIIDYKALVGDTSDGYPGVNGIGPKTAANLLKQFGTFENIYKHISDISPSTSEKLAVDAEQGALAKKLATIVTDVPINLDLDTCNIVHITKERLQNVFQGLDFHSMQKRLAGMKGIISEKNASAGEQMNFL